MFNNVLRSILAVALIVGLGNLPVAQYGGGGGMPGGGMPGTPTYNSHRSYSNKGAIIGGIAGGVAAVGGLLYWKHHNRAKLVGCVRGNGDQLVSEKNNQREEQSDLRSLEPGERRLEARRKGRIVRQEGQNRFGRAHVRGPQDEQGPGTVHRDKQLKTSNNVRHAKGGTQEGMFSCPLPTLWASMAQYFHENQ